MVSSYKVRERLTALPIFIYGHWFAKDDASVDRQGSDAERGAFAVSMSPCGPDALPVGFVVPAGDVEGDKVGGFGFGGFGFLRAGHDVPPSVWVARHAAPMAGRWRKPIIPYTGAKRWRGPGIEGRPRSVRHKAKRRASIRM